MRNGFGVSQEAPLFISLSNNSRGQRLGYSGIYELVKDFAEARELDDIHHHRMRHTFATSLVAAGMNPFLAKRAVRIRSDKIFARYSDRALDIKEPWILKWKRLLKRFIAHQQSHDGL